MLGHTHKDIDQMFSCFSRHLSKRGAQTLLELPLQNQIIWDIYGPTTGLIWFNLWAIYGRYMALFYFILLDLPTRAGSPQQHKPITVGPFYLTHPVNFPCGRKPEYPGKTHDFGRALTFYSFHMRTGFESH
jgi:hypothetical protein